MHILHFNSVLIHHASTLQELQGVC